MNEAKLDVPETGPETAPSPKIRSSVGMVLLLVAVALVSSAGGSVMSWILITKTMKAGATTAAPVAPVDPEKQKAEDLLQAMEKGGVLTLDPFVVNLADADAARYLRIKVILMVEDKGRMKELTENTTLQLKVRDIILQTLTEKTSGELMNDAGKNKLRAEIQDKITGYFKKPKLLEVMFSDFVIQL